MAVLRYRGLCAGVALVCAVLIGMALYFEHVMGMEPCPLCIFQRVAVMALGGVALLAALHNPAALLGRRIYSGLMLLSAAAGAVVAGRHVWLQHLPKDQVPECGPGLSYIMDVLPLSQVLGFVFKGSGECALVDWRLLGLSMPEWTLIAFITFMAVSVFLLLSRAMRR